MNDDPEPKNLSCFPRKRGGEQKTKSMTHTLVSSKKEQDKIENIDVGLRIEGRKFSVLPPKTRRSTENKKYGKSALMKN
jgi:hypothetical protein